MTEKTIKVRVWRGEAAAGRLEEYSVASSERLSVMALLAAVHELDPSFACRTSTCYRGQCGSCLVRVNGCDVLGCVELISPGQTVTIEPHSGYRGIRDTVVDFALPLKIGDRGGQV